MMKRKALALSAFLLMVVEVFATHNRAGEIILKQIGDLTLRATIVTYTKTSSFSVDRDSLEINWGDGTKRMVHRANGFGELLPNDVKRNYYIAEHTYPGRATYTISMTDPNRNAGILNVNPPSSENVTFYIETRFTFLNPQFSGYNNSSILLQPPIDIACVGQPYYHNPNAFDPDGDSLSYDLVVPLQEVNLQVPNYAYPDQVISGLNNKISINRRTGDFVWNAPQLQGEYNIAIRINEYRQGVLINSVLRDMQILVKGCINRPPTILAPDQLCVIAGNAVNITVTADDPDALGGRQKVKLSALGAPFEMVVDPAIFQVPFGFNVPPILGIFKWTPSCNAISKEPYNLVFKAEDNFFDTSGLSILKNLRIKVLGPPPINVKSEKQSNAVLVSWMSPYFCQYTSDQYFKGFNIYRREGSNNFVQDSCLEGLEGKGYLKIASLVKSLVGARYEYKDSTIQKGKTYCYRVLAQFSKNTPAGFSFNVVESLPSEESCLLVNLDLPIITKVSVETTSTTNGKILIKWKKPKVPDLDTILYPPPYTYTVHKGMGLNPTNFVEIMGSKSVFGSYTQLSDSSWLDTLINTVSGPYAYEIHFAYGSDHKLYGKSESASSVFLSAIPSDKKLSLVATHNVPWKNTLYVLYKKNQITGNFVEIQSNATGLFEDNPLENGIEQCYRLTTFGKYNIPSWIDTLTNDSQEICAIPVDTVPPCPVVLSVENQCINPTLNQNDLRRNILRWGYDPGCNSQRNAQYFRIYFRPKKSSPWVLLDSLAANQSLIYKHLLEGDLTGCYKVQGVDELGNENQQGIEICVEDCQEYVLPNAFSPNGDGSNDLFKPRRQSNISEVSMVIFNKWGNKVFETNDPQILWSGKTSSGKELPTGTYYYIGEIGRFKSTGELTKSAISGYIELIR